MITKLFQMLLPYEAYSYYIIFAILIACGLGVPIPEDITLAAGGILVSYEITNFWKTLAVCLTGVLVGDIFVFVIGRYYGSRILKSKFLSKMVKARRIALVKLATKKYGNYVIFFARFMPGLRTPVYFSMGSFKKPFYIFFIIDGFAALISVPVWIYIGMIFGQNLPLLEHYLKNMRIGIYLLGIVLIVVIISFHFLNKKITAWILKRPTQLSKSNIGYSAPNKK